MKDNEKKDKPTIAPGMDDYEDLKQDATEEEKKTGIIHLLLRFL